MENHQNFQNYKKAPKILLNTTKRYTRATKTTKYLLIPDHLMKSDNIGLSDFRLRALLYMCVCTICHVFLCSSSLSKTGSQWHDILWAVPGGQMRPGKGVCHIWVQHLFTIRRAACWWEEPLLPRIGSDRSSLSTRLLFWSASPGKTVFKNSYWSCFKSPNYNITPPTPGKTDKQRDGQPSTAVGDRKSLSTGQKLLQTNNSLHEPWGGRFQLWRSYWQVPRHHLWVADQRISG